VVDDAMQAFFEGGGTEVDEQADGQMEQAEIGQDLFGMDRSEILDRFQLHDHHAFNEQVNAKTVFEA
jgi:hypothetical protein